MTARQAGFTVLEVMAALAIFSIVMTVIAGALRFSADVWQRAETRLLQADEVLRTDFVLREALDAAAVTRLADDAGIGFTGTPEQMRFSAHFADAALPGGAYFIQLNIQQTDEGAALLLSRTPLAGLPNAPYTATLGVYETAPAFSYFDGAVWRRDWTQGKRLPHLIRLQIRDGVPLFTAAPKAAFAPPCLTAPGAFAPPALAEACQ